MYNCSQPLWTLIFCCAYIQTAKKPCFSSYFEWFLLKFLQNQSKFLEIDFCLNFFIIQSEESAWGRSKKRPQANSAVLSTFDADFTAQSTNSPRKRAWKTSQLPEFSIYQDEISTTNANKYFSQDGPAPIEFGLKLGKICLNISVEIPFRSEFRSISAVSDPKKRSRQPLASISSIALNGTQKAPKIPRNWLEKQPNDHTSMLFSSIWAILSVIICFLTNWK